jgi:hypothetical protein
VTQLGADGSIEVTRVNRPDMTDSQEEQQVVRLPADYVAEHVELGYATTAHRAQGITVDTAHTIAGPGMNRQVLYVAMTRGRDANHVYACTDSPALEDYDPTGPVSGRQILEQVLTTDGAERSATAALRARQNQASSLRHLLPIRETLTGARTASVGNDNSDVERAVDEVSALIRLRATLARAARHPDTRGPRRPAHFPPGRDGIGR